MLNASFGISPAYKQQQTHNEWDSDVMRELNNYLGAYGDV